MDTRIGYPNEHLGKGDKPELESPMYATAIGLLMKGVGENEKRPQPKEVVEAPIDPTDGPIVDLEDDEGSIKKPIEIEKQGSASVFDKWVNKILDFLANED
jgi:cell division protein FtsA